MLASPSGFLGHGQVQLIGTVMVKICMTLQSEDHKVSESMKTIYKLTLLVFLFLSSFSTVAGQNAENVLDEVTRTLASPDAANRLAQYFEERVEISLLGKRQAYSRTQAQYVVEQFLADHPIGRFNLVDKGKTSDSVYATGECQTESGEFEVNIFIRLSSGRVNEMQFERK